MEKKTKKGIVGILITTALVVSLTGCITEAPTKENYLVEYYPTNEQLSELIGINETEVQQYKTDFDVKIYTTDNKTALEIYEDYGLKYKDWTEHMNGSLFESEKLTIYTGVWRQIVDVHSIIVAEGTLVHDETSYNTVVITSHGTIDEYYDLLDEEGLV